MTPNSAASDSPNRCRVHPKHFGENRMRQRVLSKNLDHMGRFQLAVAATLSASASASNETIFGVIDVCSWQQVRQIDAFPVIALMPYNLRVLAGVGLKINSAMGAHFLSVEIENWIAILVGFVAGDFPASSLSFSPSDFHECHQCCLTFSSDRGIVYSCIFRVKTILDNSAKNMRNRFVDI